MVDGMQDDDGYGVQDGIWDVVWGMGYRMGDKMQDGDGVQDGDRMQDGDGVRDGRWGIRSRYMALDGGYIMVMVVQDSNMCKMFSLL